MLPSGRPPTHARARWRVLRVGRDAADQRHNLCLLIEFDLLLRFAWVGPPNSLVGAPSPLKCAFLMCSSPRSDQRRPPRQICQADAEGAGPLAEIGHLHAGRQALPGRVPLGTILLVGAARQPAWLAAQCGAAPGATVKTRANIAARGRRGPRGRSRSSNAEMCVSLVQFTSRVPAVSAASRCRLPPTRSRARTWS